MPLPPPVLDIQNLAISFATRQQDIPAVMDFSLTIQPGEAVGLVGESGCGKSTVALAVMRDLGRNGRFVEGSIRFNGRDMAAMNASELRRLRGKDIAMIYQEPMASLNPAMTVGRQLMEVPMLHDALSRAEARARALQMLEDVQLPDPERILESYPHHLSGGQQQRIVIAMALMSNPALLILDEPTTALDVTVEAAIITLIKSLARKYDTAMLFISHNMGLVLDCCDRICVMYSGEVVETGPVDTVFRQMRHPYTRALLRALPLPGTDKTERPLKAIPGNFPLPQDRPLGCTFAPRCDEVLEGLCDQGPVAMETVCTGHKSRCLRWQEIEWHATAPVPAAHPASPPGEVVLEVRALRKHYRLTKRFGGAKGLVKANEGIDFTARSGETLAIVGESGCGKSTLAKVLMGLETASSGEVLLAGEDIATLPVRKRGAQRQRRIQMVFQNPFDTLNPSIRVGRQIQRTLEIFGIGATDNARRDRMFDLLDLVKLPRSFADRLPRQLSGGQKQRVGIARALAGHAQIVVADEPVSALDVSVQAAVAELLMDLQRQQRITLIFISHDLSIVRYLSDRVLVMYLGHVVEIGTTDQVFAPPYHPYTQALLSAAPVADPKVQRHPLLLEGDLPSALDPPPGCPFQTRCQWKHLAKPGLCDSQLPALHQISPSHSIRCHLPHEVLRDVMGGPRIKGQAPQDV